MSASLASFKETVEKLIRRFESDRPYYLSKGYSEAQARVDFVTPFFKALGWDVENEAGLPHYQREVIVERGESETTGRPDYNFRIGGQTKFFVEAKAPSEGLGNPHHIVQAKGYAWNTRSVFFVILTDFEGFHFYDASRQPDERNPDEGLLLKLGRAEYLENAEKLWEFSRERVAAGSLDVLLPKIRRAPHLRKQVDEVFLDEMTGWREDLAKDIHKQNPTLTAKQLNEVVQRLLDRIVFIRIAEDRHVVEKRQLAEVVEEWEAHGGKFPIFDWLNALFHKINEDFNGEIFKPHLSEEIQIDSEILARIIRRLYPPKSPYRFDVIGVELLGSIYERYLGNTIRLTPKQVRVEEKPEVRKAGGVYYTPKYIVDYIVKNTVGKIIGGKSPRQIEKIRILDPACGSGSFLIGAFQYLIDYHTQWYLEHPEQEVRHAHPSLDFMREVRTDPDGSKRLSVYRKAKILRNNLFGVDIDPQAVEITMMSLYLKALEGEQSQLPPKQHLLPELKYNIMCGNSLIGPDIYDQGALFDDEERDRINAFDWNFVPPVAAVYDRRAYDRRDAVPAVCDRRQEPALIERRHSKRTSSAPTTPTSIGQVMKEGGFDCVIGNPPYIRIQDLAEWAPMEADYCKQHYLSARQGNFDIYIVFLEKGLSLLRNEGLLGLIVPRKFMQASYGEGIRGILTENKHIKTITNFSNNQVFEDSFVNTCVLVLGKKPGQNFEHVFIPKLALGESLPTFVEALGSSEPGRVSVDCLESSNLGTKPWVLATRADLALLKKLTQGNSTLEQSTDRIFQGLKTSADKIYILEVRDRRRDFVEVFSKHTAKVHRLEPTLLKSLIRGGDSDRYRIRPTRLMILFPYMARVTGGVELVEEGYLRDELPLTYAYLREVKGYLERREGGKTKGSGWYRYIYPKNFEVICLPKIITPDLAEKASFSYDETGEIFFTGGAAGGYGILPKKDLDSRYLLGLLNSKVVDWFIRTSGTQMESGYFSYEARFIRSAPIRPVDFCDPADKARHDKLVALVDRMLELNKKKHSGKLAPSELDRLEREVASTDREIDELVYELYGITDEERRIVEEAGQGGSA